MKTREKIARALRSAEVSNLSVARQLGCRWREVDEVRRELGIPTYQRGRRPAAATAEAAYTALAVAVDGGHRRWTGATHPTGTPVLYLRTQAMTVYRLAFRIEHGREPEGNVRPTCGYPFCVAGDHLEDRRLRQAHGRGST